jgi:hypothetical protein
VVDIEPVLDSVVAMLDCHRSQFYDWLPYNKHFDEPPPEGDDERRAWLGRWYRRRIAPLADRFRELVVKTYGPERGPDVRYIEAFEPCEYGSPLDDAAARRLFPFEGRGARGEGRD